MEKDNNPNKSLRSLNESFSRIVNGEPPKNKEEKLSEQWPFQMPWDKPFSTPEDAPDYIEPSSSPLSPAPPPWDGMDFFVDEDGNLWWYNSDTGEYESTGSDIHPDVPKPPRDRRIDPRSPRGRRPPSDGRPPKPIGHPSTPGGQQQSGGQQQTP